MATNNSVNSPLSGTTGTGNFVGSTSPAITTPSLGTLNDTSGNAALQFIPSAGGSWVTLQNTSSPQLQAAGSASNIILYLKSKGDAAVSFVTSAVSARPIEIYSGTAGQHLTQFAFSNTAASRVVTFPDLSGTVALSGASQTVTFNGVTAGITATASSLNQSASNTTFTGTGVLSQQFIPNSTSYSELAGYDFATSGGATPYARIAAYRTVSGSIIKMGTSNNYGSGITNTAVTIDQSGVVTLSSALPISSGGTGVTNSNWTAGSLTFSPTTQGIVGTTTNDSAGAGYVGEFVSSVILVGSKVTLTANVVANITSISLTAGDWDVWGNVNISSTAQTQTYSFAWISQTSATQPADAYIQGLQISQPITINNYHAITPLRFSLSATTTVYLSVVGDGGGTLSGWGAIYARRVR